MITELFNELLHHVTSFLTVTEIMTKFILINRHCHSIAKESGVWQNRIVNVRFTYDSMLHFLQRYKIACVSLEPMDDVYLWRVLSMLRQDLVALDVKSFSRSQSADIPREIFPNLKTANLFGVTELGEFIELMPNVQSLTFFCSGIFPIRALMGLKRLKELTVNSDLKLGEIESIVSNLKLSKLQIHSDINAVDLMSRIRHSKGADYLESLSINYTGSYDDSSKSVLYGVTDLTTDSSMRLKELRCINLPLDISLSLALQSMKSLEKLTISSDGSDELIPIPSLACLTELQLTGVSETFVIMFLEACPSITTLHLSEIHGSEETVSQHTVPANLSCKLKVVDISTCTAFVANSVLSGLATHVSLLSLQKTLVDGVHFNPRIERIRNYLGPFELISSFASINSNLIVDFATFTNNSPLVQFNSQGMSCTRSIKVVECSDEFNNSVLEQIHNLDKLQSLQLVHFNLRASIKCTSKSLPSLRLLELSCFNSAFPVIEQLEQSLCSLSSLTTSLTILELSCLVNKFHFNLEQLAVVLVGCKEPVTTFRPFDHLPPLSITIAQSIPFDELLTLLLSLPKGGTYSLSWSGGSKPRFIFGDSEPSAENINSWIKERATILFDTVLTDVDPERKQSVLDQLDICPSGLFSQLELICCLASGFSRRALRRGLINWGV